MNILVTGGAGYIGSITANQLNSLEHNVVVLDDLSEGKKKSVQDIKLYYGSYSDEQYVFDILIDNNCVFLIILMPVPNLFRVIRFSKICCKIY